MATVTAKPRIRWTAASDRVSHAHRPGRQVRALCGTEAVDERDAWPELRRCIACDSLAKEDNR